MTPLALVVENDSGTRRLLEVVVSRAGFEVDSIANGQGAISLCRELDYSVIVLDLLLPFTSGFEVLDWMQRERPELLPRVSVVSSVPHPRLAQVQERYGVRTMRKPFDLQELVDVVTKAEVVAPRDRGLVGTFCRLSVAAGAKSGLLVRPNGAELELLARFGYAPADIESYLPLPANGPYPICTALETGEPVWLPSLPVAASEYPLLLPLWEQLRTQAIVALPLRRDGELVGAAGWSFREPIRLEYTRRELQAIANRLAARIPSAEESPRRAHA